MKRMHLHLSVGDIDRSVAFYSHLFGAAPAVRKSDYAKWMLDDPRVNFAISSQEGPARGVDHIGIQAESSEELGEVYGRIAKAGRPMLEEGETTCCYAQSEKGWVADPDGVLWEAFHTTGESTVYGDRGQVERASACCAPAPNAASGACC